MKITVAANVSIRNGVYIAVKNNQVIINGITYPKPGRGNNSTIINNKVYVNGYELVRGEWKKTLRAILYQFFLRGVKCYIL